MQKTMLAVVKPAAAPGAEIREMRVPEFGRTEVLVKVKIASICGTDLHIYEWDRWAQGRIHPPLVPGHEFCGEVVACGDEVTSVREGDFVSAEMHVACGKCLQCRTGEAHICQNVRIIGVDTDGAFAEYVVIPESNIWKLDPAIPQEYASILDPLGNAVHSVLAGEIAAKTVAITGCGPIGLFAIAVARAVGAARVFAIEVNQHRRKIAAEMKADLVLDPSSQDVRAAVLEETGGLGADVVLEMAGHPMAIRTRDNGPGHQWPQDVSNLVSDDRALESKKVGIAPSNHPPHRDERFFQCDGEAENRRSEQDSGLSQRSKGDLTSG